MQVRIGGLKGKMIMLPFAEDTMVLSDIVTITNNKKPLTRDEVATLTTRKDIVRDWMLSEDNLRKCFKITDEDCKCGYRSLQYYIRWNYVLYRFEVVCKDNGRDTLGYSGVTVAEDWKGFLDRLAENVDFIPVVMEYKDTCRRMVYSGEKLRELEEPIENEDSLNSKDYYILISNGSSYIARRVKEDSRYA